jgi:hypothetical protein
VDAECTANSYCTAGGKCLAKGAPGQACADGNQCLSTFCVDGVCCNSNCGGQCEACAVPGKVGTCSPVLGAPPASKPRCSGNGTGCDGTCNGADTTACVMPGENVRCRAPACAAGAATLEETCDGSGTCPPARTQSCGAVGCDGALCTGCKVDTECAAGSYCRAGICTTLADNGATCSRDDECESGNCVDGLCCDTGCSGQCEACNVPGKRGTCSPATGKPVGTRAACAGEGSLCGGACDGTDRLGCTYPGFGTLCVEPSCANDRATVAAFCNGSGLCPAGETVDCPEGCDRTGTLCDNGCVGTCSSLGTYCSGGVCVPLKQIGESCSTLQECVSSYCIDGVCCDRACDGQCEACDVAGTEGSCRPVAGAPHGSRTACASDGGTCAGRCDGGTPDRCVYPGGERACRGGTCTAGVAVLASTCQGNGACGPLQQQRCTAAGCAPSAVLCSGDCTTDAQCAANAYCSGGVCAPRLGNGAACATARHCTSGNCVDGVCCDTGCTGRCEACDVSGQEGTCVASLGPPRNGRAACPGSGACGGFCDGTNRTTCAPSTGDDCGQSYCANGFFTDVPRCVATQCHAPDAVTCDPFACSAEGTCAETCATDGDCAFGLVCEGGTCVEPPEGVDAGARPDASAGSGGQPSTGGRSATGGRSSGGASTIGPDASSTGGAAATGGNRGGTRDAGTDAGRGPGSVSDQGDCGCRLSTERPAPVPLSLAALGVLGLLARRRKASPRERPRQ